MAKKNYNGLIILGLGAIGFLGLGGIDKTRTLFRTADATGGDGTDTGTDTGSDTMDGENIDGSRTENQDTSTSINDKTAKVDVPLIQYRTVVINEQTQQQDSSSVPNTQSSTGKTKPIQRPLSSVINTFGGTESPFSGHITEKQDIIDYNKKKFGIDNALFDSAKTKVESGRSGSLTTAEKLQIEGERARQNHFDSRSISN